MAVSQVDTRKEHDPDGCGCVPSQRGEPGSEARREAIGKELESIEKERRNIELVLEKIKAADSVQDGTEEKK